MLFLAMETAVNDALLDHIQQLEDYLKRIETTFSKLSLGLTDFSASPSTEQLSTGDYKTKMIPDYGFLKPI